MGTVITTEINTNCNTFEIEPQPRNLSDPRFANLKKELLSEIPKDKPILVPSTMSNAESADFAKEIYEVFKGNGFHMKQTGASQAIFNEPLKGVGRHTDQDGNVEIQVGSQ
jgi:hypothetical protein